MRTVAEIFAQWPSDADFGREIGVAYSTVAAWKQRGSIPTAYWRSIITAARRRGFRHVDADLLVDVHSRRPGAPAATGFAEDGAPSPMPEKATSGERTESSDGHFSRHRRFRRQRFKTAAEIEDHIRALRDEWSHR
jgi:hypothetical protein